MKNTLKVVLADDEALIRLDIREMLTEAGHEVAGEANNGEDAVAMTRALQPDHGCENAANGRTYSF